jgi:hypothetical protein
LKSDLAQLSLFANQTLTVGDYACVDGYAVAVIRSSADENGNVYFKDIGGARAGTWTAVIFPNESLPGLDPTYTPAKVVPHSDLTQLNNAVAQHRDGWIGR